MTIERFIWTEHAQSRLEQRRLPRSAVEAAIRDGHHGRRANDGDADWLIAGITATGIPFESIYDHPVRGDHATVLIVSAWRL